MAVIISIVGGNKESDEYKAALKLRDIILESVPNEVIGEIVLYVSATFMGQEVKDVDIMMVGMLKNYSVKVGFNTKEQEYKYDSVDIENFCTTIEIKSHSMEGIKRIGTDFYVKYGENLHCVTEQSNLQRIAGFNFLKKTLSYSPFITNIIWFTEAPNSDIKKLLDVDGTQMPSNIIGADFDFKELIQLLVWQKIPIAIRDKNIFNCFSENTSMDMIVRALKLFSDSKENMGELTRNRIEQIINKKVSEIFNNNEEKLSIYRGRAGTGKTVGLIRNAIQLVEDKHKRVLMLTYNKALVSDMRRLFTLAELPDLFEESCISINTMQAYFYRLISKLLYDGKLDGEEFINEYQKFIREILEFIDSDEEAIKYIKELCEKDCTLDWDYILIDEAQDWTNFEKELIMKLYKPENIIIADGGQQFVRDVEMCDWTLVKEKNVTKLKQCLRQKSNLVKFINHLLSEYGTIGGKIISSEKLYGGKIIILEDKSKLYEIHKEEMEKLRKAGNIAYDMLYLVPHTMVEKDEEERHFKYTYEFEKNGIFLWDGTNEENRGSYGVDADEIRLLQYDSARGLEGWTVFCLEFDKFLESKEKLFNPDQNNNALMLESTEERRNKYILNWALIAMTRAIDTLVITIDNPESEIGKILEKIAKEYPDYVTLIK